MYQNKKGIINCTEFKITKKKTEDHIQEIRIIKSQDR